MSNKALRRWRYGNGNTKLPFPWFGGKSLAASLIWEKFGQITSFVDPFFGGGAVLLNSPYIPKYETINDLDGYVCLDANTKILCDDLSWIRIKDVQIGQSLLGFDEENSNIPDKLQPPSKYRRWCPTKITKKSRVIKPCYRLTFDDGTTVIASADHLWLCGPQRSGSRSWRWLKTESMICNRKTQRSWVLKACDVTEREDSYESGWLSGFYDGEGSINISPGLRICLTQKAGEEADRAKSILAERGFDVVELSRTRATEKRREITYIGINGGMREVLRLLMLIRPERLIRKLQANIHKLSLYGRHHSAAGLMKKEHLGEREVVAIETGSRTFIAEGLASHNCNFFRAVKESPESVAEHSHYPKCELDLHARNNWFRTHNFSKQLRADPYFFDSRIAGWWAWGVALWIGRGWCSANSTRGMFKFDSKGLHTLKHIDDKIDYLQALSERLMDVKILCGDWSYALSNTVIGKTWSKAGDVGILLDPPYSAESGRYNKQLYAEDSTTVAHDVKAWAIEHGELHNLKIAFCGFDGEHEFPENWACEEWKSSGGMGVFHDNDIDYQRKERIWFSPGCLRQLTLGF